MGEKRRKLCLTVEKREKAVLHTQKVCYIEFEPQNRGKAAKLSGEVCPSHKKGEKAAHFMSAQHKIGEKA